VENVELLYDTGRTTGGFAVGVVFIDERVLLLIDVEVASGQNVVYTLSVSVTMTVPFVEEDEAPLVEDGVALALALARHPWKYATHVARLGSSAALHS